MERDGPQVRNMKFDFRPADLDDWIGGNPGASMFLNAISVTFPLGERFHIESVKAFLGDIGDEGTRKEIGIFFGQEAVHSREHFACNAAMSSMGYDIAWMEKRFASHLERLRKKASPEYCLAITCAYEHVTAVMADILLRDRGWLKSSRDTDVMRFWLWHASEELEHKSVAYDVLMSRRLGVSGYFARCWALIWVTAYFLFSGFLNMRVMMRDMPLRKRAGLRLSLWRFLLFRPALFTRALPGLFLYLMPGFHPSWISDGEKRDVWKETLESIPSRLSPA